MNRLRTGSRFATVLLLSLMLQSCVAGMQLRTASADRTRIDGTYTLMLYGCHYPDQIENVAILVDESGRYPIEIYDLETSFKVKKGVPAQEAIAEAEAFVRCSFHTVWQTRVSRILDDRGGSLGYEFRPLYAVTEFGTSDVLLISYSLKEGKVRAYIRKSPDLEDRFNGGGDGRGFNRH